MSRRGAQAMYKCGPPKWPDAWGGTEWQCRNPIHRAHYELFIRSLTAPNVEAGYCPPLSLPFALSHSCFLSLSLSCFLSLSLSLSLPLSHTHTDLLRSQ